METLKRVALRGLRGFVAGAVASMSTLLVSIGNDNISNLKDLQVWLGVLSISGIVGGISGLILSIDKWFRSE